MRGVWNLAFVPDMHMGLGRGEERQWKAFFKLGSSGDVSGALTVW